MLFPCRVQGIRYDVLEKCCINCWGIWDIILVLLGIRGWARLVFLNVSENPVRRVLYSLSLEKAVLSQIKQVSFPASLIRKCALWMINDVTIRVYLWYCLPFHLPCTFLLPRFQWHNSTLFLLLSGKKYFAYSFPPLTFFLWKWLRVWTRSSALFCRHHVCSSFSRLTR